MPLHMCNEIKKFHNNEDVDTDLLCKNCDQLYAPDDPVLIYNSKYGKERINRLWFKYKISSSINTYN